MANRNKRFDLITAIDQQDIDQVINLVDQLDTLNYVINYKSKTLTPLIKALITITVNYNTSQTDNYIKIIKYLLDHKSDPNYPIRNQIEFEYPFISLLRYNNIDTNTLFNVIKMLIEYGINIDPISDMSSLEYYILHITIKHQGNRFYPTLHPYINYPEHQNIINLLLNNGVYPTDKTMSYLEKEQSTLNEHIIYFETYRNGRIELLESILNSDVESVIANLSIVKNPNFLIYYHKFKYPRQQLSPLFASIYAYFQIPDDNQTIKNKSIQIIKHLLNNGCDPNYKVDSENIITKIMIDFGQNLEIIDMLVSNGALIDTKYEHNYTPLMLSITKKYDEITMYLLEHNADPNYSTTIGSPLELAIENNEKYVDVLISYGAILEDLMISKIKYGRFSDVEQLIQHGANVNKICKNTTPLITAINTGSYNIAKLLVDNGADVNLSVNGNSPMLELSKQMYKSAYPLTDLIELIVKNSKFDPSLNQILLSDDIEYHQLDPSKYIKSILNQQSQFEEFALSINNIQYKNFNTNDLKLVDLLNSWNHFKITTITDIDETIKLLKNIIGAKFGIRRKEMIKTYYKLNPHGISDGFRISDSQITDHIKYWNLVKSKLGTSKLENTTLNKLKHESTGFQMVQTLFNDISKIKDNLVQTDIPDMKLFKIIDIYQISIPVQESQWNQRLDKTESTLLWHGTDKANLLSILRTGFTIINQIFDPIEPKRTGKAFGDGIYFADLAYKSLFYSDNLRNECHKPRPFGSGWLFLADVDLGNTFNSVTTGDYVNSTSQHHSITANASVYSTLKYNEYVIKTQHINRINPKYLLLIECNQK